IEEIWAFDHAQLEAVHNYIQQLFPLRTPGVAEAPLLDDATVATFRAEEGLRQRLLRSLDLMLGFYGLQREQHEITRKASFTERSRNWLTPHNHNFLRLTRILSCLRELGLGEWSQALLRCLESIYAEQARVVGHSINFWRHAVQ